jgi:hypothetical protein
MGEYTPPEKLPPDEKLRYGLDKLDKARDQIQVLHSHLIERSDDLRADTTAENVMLAEAVASELTTAVADVRVGIRCVREVLVQRTLAERRRS